MTPFRRAIAVLILAAPALGGGVVTRDGRTIDGAVVPAGAGTVRVTPAGGGEPVTVELANARKLSFETAAAPATRPAWEHRDLGSVHLPGAASERDGTLSLAGSGWGAWGPRDSGQFAYWPLEGDGQIIAHVASQAGGGGAA